LFSMSDQLPFNGVHVRSGGVSRLVNPRHFVALDGPSPR
jgi:hypothetical protein